MTARKPRTTVAPVLSPDMEFVRDLDARKDKALAEIQRLSSERITKQADYAKQVDRINAQWALEAESIDGQLAQQDRIVTGVNAAHEAIAAPGNNVVPMKAAE